MAIKSDAELALLRESCKWANLAHTLLQRYTRPGVSETEVETRASTEATYAMLDAIGPIYRAQSPWFSGAVAGYRGQIGRNAAIPHALPNNIVFQAGDVLVTGATAPVWGYHSELERTMVIGPPSDEQKRLFDHMVALQDLAIDVDPARASRARRSTGACARTTRSTGSGRTGATTSGTRSGCATTRGRSSTAATRRRSARAWSSPSSRASTRRARRLPPLRHRRGHGRRRRVAHVLPARPRVADAAGVTDLYPFLAVRDVARAVAYYEEAFGAVEEGERLEAPDGRQVCLASHRRSPCRRRQRGAGARHAEPETAGAHDGADLASRSTILTPSRRTPSRPAGARCSPLPTSRTACGRVGSSIRSVITG